MEVSRSHSVRWGGRARLAAVAAGLAVAAAALVATGHASAARAGARVKVEQTALGRILATAQGRTLYMFAADKHGKSTCYGTCAAFWPPLLTTSAHVVGAGVKASLLGTTKRSDGKLQVTYNRHPLYLFVKDEKAGQTNGQGLNASGGLWWVLSPSGSVVRKTGAAAPAAPAAPAPPTTTQPSGTGGGYGYSYGG